MTRAEFDSRIKTRSVVVLQDGEANDLTGVVVGFLPNLMLRILDDFGAIHVVPIYKVKADRGRKIANHTHDTTIHIQDAS